MIKMLTRLQKAQLPSLYKWTAGSGVFDKTLHELAGYRNFQVAMVGGTGGRSGSANGSTTANIVYSSGGGGGGLLIVAGALEELDIETSYGIGVGGADGFGGSNKQKAGNGVAGGDTSFGDFWAQGGRGAIGGQINQSGTSVTYTAGIGGAGGSNSAAIGSGGVGGQRAVLPTPGQYAILGGLSGGRGGGGGPGRVKVNGDVLYAAQDGAEGNQGSVYAAPGAGDATNRGGNGGGANVGSLLPDGLAEYYGGTATGHNVDGVVILTLT